MTSHTPSHPMMRNSSSLVNRHERTSGHGSTKGVGTFQSMSPKALRKRDGREGGREGGDEGDGRDGKQYGNQDMNTHANDSQGTAIISQACRCRCPQPSLCLYNSRLPFPHSGTAITRSHTSAHTGTRINTLTHTQAPPTPHTHIHTHTPHTFPHTHTPTCSYTRMSCATQFPSRPSPLHCLPSVHCPLTLSRKRDRP